MAREGVHVFDALGNPLRGGGATHALVERNAHARGQALERADDQLVAVEEVEADPVQVRQGVVDQRRQVGRIGDAVALAMHQGTGLGQQLAVLFRLAAGKRGGIEHGRSLPSRTPACAGAGGTQQTAPRRCRDGG